MLVLDDISRPVIDVVASTRLPLPSLSYRLVLSRTKLRVIMPLSSLLVPSARLRVVSAIGIDVSRPAALGHPSESLCDGDSCRLQRVQSAESDEKVCG